MMSFDQFLSANGRPDLVLGRATPLTSRIAVALKSTLDEKQRASIVKDLYRLHDIYREQT
jgi:hypothetical protein